jgi:phospholipid-binding lipoprotein MlaA
MSRRLAPRTAALLLAAALAGTTCGLHAQSDGAALTPVPAPQSASSSSSAQAAPDDDFDDYATLKVSDPFEGINRRVFKLNDILYTRVLSPAVKGYEYVVRPPVNRAIANFYDNVRYPVRLVANLAQLKVERAGRETGKFVVNTVAFLGFFRTAEHVPALAGIPREDLGQALGYWGVPHGPYVVVPLLGGASLRDYAGRLGDTVASPTGWDYINFANREWLDALDLRWQLAITGTDVMSGLPDSLKLYTSFKQAAVDPYLSVRDATRRYRDRETAR